MTNYERICADKAFCAATIADVIGKIITIKSKESFHNKGWGRVVDFDGEYYHVAMYDGKNDVCIFGRNEIKVDKVTNRNV